MDIRLTDQVEQWLLGLAEDGGHDTTNRAEAIASAIGDLHQSTGFDAYWPEWTLDELAAFAALLATETVTPSGAANDDATTSPAARWRSLSQRWEQHPDHGDRFRLDHDTVGDRLAGLTRTEDRILQSRIRRWLDTQHTNSIDAWSAVGLTAITPPDRPTISRSYQRADHSPADRPTFRPAVSGLSATANHAGDRYDLPGAIPSYLEQAQARADLSDAAHVDDHLSDGSIGSDLPDYWYAPPPPGIPGLPGI